MTYRYTCPLYVSDTTLCTNLNADLLDGKHATSFIMQGLEVVGFVELTTNVTTVSFTNLDLNSARCYMLLFGIRNQTSGYGHIYLFFNGDTTISNYVRDERYWYNGLSGGGRYDETSICYVHPYLSSVGNGIIMHPGAYPIYHGSSAERVSTTSIGIALRQVYWENIPDNVTRIDITSSFPNGLGFASKFLLLGGRGLTIT